MRAGGIICLAGLLTAVGCAEQATAPPVPVTLTDDAIGHYDNSAGNLNNPDPEEWVRWGDQTWEEMFIGYYDYVRPLGFE